MRKEVAVDGGNRAVEIGDLLSRGDLCSIRNSSKRLAKIEGSKGEQSGEKKDNA